MKKKIALLSALIMLSGCTAPAPSGEETITAAPITSIEQTTVTSAPKTEAVTTTTFIPSEEIKLSPVPSKQETEVLFCNVIEGLELETENEADFPNKEHLRLARELCWADSTVQERLKSNDTEPVECSDDIPLKYLYNYDFDMDGENESIITLAYLPFMSCNMTVYVDGDKAEILGRDIGGMTVSVYDFGDFWYTGLTAYYGVSGIGMGIYDFSYSKTESLLDGTNISCENNVFFVYEKACFNDYPVILYPDGVFRQLGTETITREDFEAHLENGKEYLSSLEAEGKKITEIKTCGRYRYIIEYSEKGEERIRHITLTEDEMYIDGFFDDHRVTDELLYGVDIWSLTNAKNK